MNHTSLKQSKKLVGLGLDPSTADCSYCFKGTKDGNDYYSKPDWYPVEDKTDIPCWSVGRLMEIMCEDKDYDISTSFGGWKGDKFIDEWFCIYEAEYGEVEYGEVEWEYHPVHDKTLIGACYKMMVWLLKKKKL